MKPKKVGILTWHYYLNFGSALQAYALKKTISDLGHKAKIINYRNPKHGKPSVLNDSVRLVTSYLFSHKGFMFGRRVTYPFLRFHKDYLKMGKYIMDEEMLVKASSTCDAIVCGSDQIWAPSVFNSTYFLDFVPKGIKKLSYAASIGLNDIPEELADEYSEILSDFSAISVRESKGKELLKEKCGTASTVVLDPTLLVDIEHWRTLERKPTDIDFDFSKPYLLCYFLKADNEYKESVKAYAEKNNLNIIGYSLNPEDGQWMLNEKDYIGPREFLWLVHNAHTIITDSYHGTIFCLLNHQRFITLERFSNDDAICQNSRIYQLIENFGIKDSIVAVKDDTVLSVGEVNYEEFEEKLSSLRQESKDFLKNALEGE